MLKAPLKQTATDTINTLSSRLASATLLEDRRASILGLRSFAKQYPASVASGSLRSLIECLRTDGMGLGKEEGEGDVDTVRLVLETLLMFFNPDETSPEASEDIALWLADEFSQRQDNITILLDLLDQPDYYARIYSLQLLTAISASRPERTQECILSAPLGVPRLVSVLDDGREAVRNAALLLLVDLTNVSQTELQKIIAFEDAFPRTFHLIQQEGGIGDGGIVVQDCLSLIANLTRHSSSNQSLFRESGCVPQLVELVKQSAATDAEENAYSRGNREKNAWGLLAVVRLFLEKGEVGTKPNQDAFWRYGMVQLVLNLAFENGAAPPIRTSALKTCGDMITSNAPLQEQFAALQVALITEQPATNGTKPGNALRKVYVIEALLDLVLASSGVESTDTRSAACGLIKAYFSGYSRIKLHFLQRAIAGYMEGEDEKVNLLSMLLIGPQGASVSDAPRYTFAADVISQLIFDEAEAKTMLMGVSEGDAEKGEDVVTCIQLLSGHLMTCLQNDLDPQVSVAYLSLLIVFLFDCPPAVNDCLAEGSALMGSLIATAGISNNSQVAADHTKSLLPGLCATLLGTIYEFSTKDSPIPRRTLQPFLATRLGRQRYFDALRQLRQHPAIRDAEVASEAGALDSAFDSAFIEWFKDEYGRIRRAIDKDPGIEVVPHTTAGVDRDILDELRDQIANKDQQLQALEQEGLATKQKSDQVEADHRKEMQSLQSSQRNLEAEIERIKKINEALQRDHETEMHRLQSELRAEIEKVQTTGRTAAQSAQQQHEKEIERLKGQHSANIASERGLAEDKARKAAEQRSKEHQETLDDARKAAEQRAKEHEAALEEARKEREAALDQARKEHQAILSEVQAKLEDKERAAVVMRQEHQAAKSELEKLRDEHEKLQGKHKSLEEELRRTKSMQEDLQQVNTKAMSRVKTLEAESKAKDEKISSLQESQDHMDSEKTERENKIKALEEEVEGLKAELKAERKGYGELETELNELKKNSSGGKGDKKKVAQLEKDLKAKDEEVGKEREEAKKARTELEDMLMVMSDLEGKRDEYKQKLKELGAEVSEDEDDDEDDDDEDEEAEEE